MPTTTDHTWFERLPKVELHVHLEGAIPHEALWELLQKYGGDPSVTDFDALRRRFVYRDFPHFLQTWCWKNGYLREYDDFTLIAAATAREMATQNIRYAEMFFSPIDFARHGLAPQRLTEAIRAGLMQAPQIEVALVADLVRDDGPQHGAVTLAQVNEVRDQGVVGIGIGGSEHLYPPEPFAPVYERARRLGFRTSAHAGEAAGPVSIWGALRALRVDRIGHGTRAGEDERLLDELIARRIPIEMCPISNVRTGVVPSIDDHPIRHYAERGLVVTVNTDDPRMFGNCLADEYRALHERLGFSLRDICALVLQAVDAAWLPEERRNALRAEFMRDPTWSEI